MKSAVIKFLVLVLWILVSPSVNAQNKTEKPFIKEEESYFSLGLHYISDAVFLGRKDSMTAPYLLSTLEYHHRSGFYTNGSLSYLTKANQGRVDLFLISAGYELKLEKLYGDFSATKYFFNDNSYNVISAVEADITAQIIYDLEIVNVGLASSLYFNSNSTSDFILLTSLSHDFISTNQKLQISPSIQLQMGSQKFYQEYYVIQGQQNQGNSSGNGGPGDPNIQTNILEDEAFKVMAVELGVPIGYQYKNATFLLAPYYAIPLSPSKITTGDTVVTEDLEPSLYGIIGIRYRF